MRVSLGITPRRHHLARNVHVHRDQAARVVHPAAARVEVVDSAGLAAAVAQLVP